MHGLQLHTLTCIESCLLRRRQLPGLRPSWQCLLLIELLQGTLVSAMPAAAALLTEHLHGRQGTRVATWT